MRKRSSRALCCGQTAQDASSDRSSREQNEVPARNLRRIGLGLALLAAPIAALYVRDMCRAYQRVRGKSTVISSALGDVEYAQGGQGPAVLVIHGSGGGYDQGQLMVDALLGDSFHWIVPSRFGYLRSTFHEGATFDDQARAYAALLDHLGIDRVAVIALSHGGPSALLFAVLYPDRVSSLTLLSAGVAPVSGADQADANKKGDALTTIFKYDWLYWAVSTLFKKQLMGLMGASGAVIADLTPEQRHLVKRVIDEMNPVSLRTPGVTFDNRAAVPGARIAAIRAPTLILHAADDTLQVYGNAEFAASTIPGAKLVRFDRGGHLLIAVEQAAVRSAVQKHILDHAVESPSRIP
jgi:2-hydroxy-6-oxonona-2,4-dienedioate hydrolase